MSLALIVTQNLLGPKLIVKDRSLERCKGAVPLMESGYVITVWNSQRVHLYLELLISKTFGHPTEDNK